MKYLQWFNKKQLDMVTGVLSATSGMLLRINISPLSPALQRVMFNHTLKSRTYIMF